VESQRGYQRTKDICRDLLKRGMGKNVSADAMDKQVGGREDRRGEQDVPSGRVVMIELVPVIMCGYAGLSTV